MTAFLDRSTNCHHYVHLGGCSAEQWATASDAVRLILEKIVFTKRSAKGQGLAHSDEFVEWLVRDARRILGRHFSWGRADHIIRCIFQLPVIIGHMRPPGPQTPPATPNSAPDSSPRPVKYDDSSSTEFQGGMQFAREHNLFGDGPVKCKYGSGHRPVAQGAFVSFEKGAALNPALLLSAQIATDRLVEFYSERRGGFNGPAGEPVAVQNMPTRFRLVPPFKDDLIDRIAFEQSRRTATRHSVLNSSFQGTIGKGDNVMNVPWMEEELGQWRVIQGQHPAVHFISKIPLLLPKGKDDLAGMPKTGPKSYLFLK